jgi:hypothetical protein
MSFQLSLKKLALALVLLTCTCAFSQVSPFMGLGNLQAFDNNGLACTACTLYTYQAGTTTQQATFTDYTGLYANPNPITFGSGARGLIWLTSTASYKLVLCLQNDGPSCAPADVLFSVDHVPGCMGCSTGGSSFTGTFISGSPLPATTGIVELASTDSICWRNQANNANLCISKDASDILTWTGSTIKYPETSCTVTGANEDYLCPSAANHRLVQSGNGGAYEQLVMAGQGINNSDEVTALQFGPTTANLCASVGSGLLGWDGTNICNQNVTSLTFGSTTIGLNSTAPTTNQTLQYDGTHISGFSLGFSKISSGTNSSPCTTGATAYASCSTSVSIYPTQADTNYAATCSGVGSTPTGEAFIQNVIKGTGAMVVLTVNGTSSGAVASGFNEIDCIAIHP